MDLPSSNFMADIGTKTSKYAVSYSHMVSLPKTELKHQNPTKLLEQMPLSDKYQQVLGPDQKTLLKYEEKLKKSTKMASYLKQKMLTRDDSLKRQKDDEEMERLQLPTTIFQDQDGQIRDKDGKVINLNVRRIFRFFIVLECTGQHLEYQSEQVPGEQDQGAP